MLRNGWGLVSAAILSVWLGAAGTVFALDIFTLWRQPVVPLHMIQGAWVDYRVVSQEAGRRSEDLVRIQCVGQAGGVTGRTWLVEMLPLEEREDGRLEPLLGEGLILEFSERLLRRSSKLTAVINRVVRWQGGQARELPAREWREDPLVATSMEAEFEPQTTELIGTSIRVVAGREFRCDQYLLAASDTQRVTLPRGVLEQIASRQITAAVNSSIPFLGLAFAAERTNSESRLSPPRAGFTPPAPIQRVETMELVGVGKGARPTLREH
jgi:hypothetical protein